MGTMKLQVKILTLISLFSSFLILFAVNASAAISTSVSQGGSSGNSYTTSTGYVGATHDNRQWQELSSESSWGSGVLWSTDSGSTWGNDNLYVGDTVTFQFLMHKDDSSRSHYADHLKAWVDWGQDGSYDDPADVIIFKEEPVSSTSFFTYETESFTITDSHVGHLFLRARVTCSESLLQEYFKTAYEDSANPNKKTIGGHLKRTKDWRYWHNDVQEDWHKSSGEDWWKSYEDMFAATGNYYQGEVEEWKIGVLNRPGNVIPEPGTMVLFGFGLLGIAKIGRRKSQ